MRIFISCRRSSSSIVGEIFEYLESNVGFADVFVHSGSPRDYNIPRTDVDVLIAILTKPFRRDRIELALNSALTMYGNQRSRSQIQCLYRRSMNTPKWLLTRWNSQRWSGGATTMQSIGISDAQVVLFGDLSTLGCNGASPPPKQRALAVPTWLQIMTHISQSMAGLGGGLEPKVASPTLFNGQTIDIDKLSDTVDFSLFHADFCNLGPTGLDWPNTEFRLLMHANATGDGAATALSAWRRANDPLNSGLFLSRPITLGTAHHIYSPAPLCIDKDHGARPFWLRFLSRFRIRNQRKSSKTYSYSSSASAKLRTLASNHFWRPARYRRAARELQTLGQLFIGKGGSLEASWELRRRAEQLVRKRLAALPGNRPLLLGEPDTVYALFRGVGRTGS